MLPLKTGIIVVVKSRHFVAFAVFLATLSLSAKPIKLRTQTVDSQQVGEAALDNHRGLLLVQLKGPIQAEWRAELSQIGTHLLQYVPDDAFIVRQNGTPPGQLRRLPFVTWVGPYRPEYKVY